MKQDKNNMLNKLNNVMEKSLIWALLADRHNLDDSISHDYKNTEFV